MSGEMDKQFKRCYIASQMLQDKILEHSDICASGYGLDGAIPLSAYWNEDDKSKLDVIECGFCNGNIVDFRVKEEKGEQG